MDRRPSKNGHITDLDTNELYGQNNLPETDKIFSAIHKKAEQTKVIYKGSELLSLKQDKPKCLWDPFFRDVGLHALVGEPDSGKSLFALQLALSISLHQKSFLDYPLNWKYGRAIFVETEDDSPEVAFRVKKQIISIPGTTTQLDNFRLFTPIITDINSKKSFLDQLREMLRFNPVDLVVISSYGDVFFGNDINNNAQMRETANHLHALAHEHQTLVLLIHHINKAQYGKSPSQAGIQGGSALAQKVRLTCQLSNEDNSFKSFSITKGNHIPSYVKKEALELALDETSLIFRNTGQKKAKSKISKTNKKGARKLEIHWPDIFGEEQVLSRGEILKRLENIGIAEASIGRRIKGALDSKYLVRQSHGKYSLNRSINHPP